MPTRTMFIERGEEEIELVVEYDRSRFYEAEIVWGGVGSPPEGGEASNVVAYCDGKQFALTEAELDRIYEDLDDDPRGELDG